MSAPIQDKFHEAMEFLIRRYGKPKRLKYYDGSDSAAIIFDGPVRVHISPSGEVVLGSQHNTNKLNTKIKVYTALCDVSTNSIVGWYKIATSMSDDFRGGH